MGEEQRKKLQQQLWKIANVFRGKMNPDEYRDYALGFVFYKYLSERLEVFVNKKLLSKNDFEYRELTQENKDYKKMIDAIKRETLDELGYFLLPSELFHNIAKKGDTSEDNFILDDLNKVLISIEQSTVGNASEEDFESLFSSLDLDSPKLGRTTTERNGLIVQVLLHLDEIDFKLEDSEIDILGDAYEYLIAQFASGAGKKAGEFYTPYEVSKLLAKLVTVGRNRIKSVYDPACGSGSLLLRVNEEVEEVGEFMGQEKNNTTYNLCRMNMILHGVHYTRFDIKQEDTLENPQHIDKRFDVVVANPPFSARWSASELHKNDERFSQYGRLAPKNKADYAFIAHMIHQLGENGTMGVVMPHGALFRSSAEKEIRQFLIEEKNYLDAVIGLPEKLFYGTSIPACIMIFKKCREDTENILFIDASKSFQSGKKQNKLTPENIQKIIDTYKERKTVDKFSNLVSLKEIADENDYNLNIPRYVDTFEDEEPVDLDEVAKKIQDINKDMKETDEKIQQFCKELGIESPF